MHILFSPAFSRIRYIVASLNLDSLPLPRREPVAPLLPPSSLASLPPSGLDFESLIGAIVDDGRLNEFKGDYGDSSLKTRAGFAHLDGRLVGVLAILGPITVQDAIKGAHFIQLTSQRDVPLIVFQNCHGSDFDKSTPPSPSAAYEVTSLLRAHAQLMTAFACCGSPTVTVAVGPNDHSSGFAVAPPSAGSRFSFAWPHADPPVAGLIHLAKCFGNKEMHCFVGFTEMGCDGGENC